MTVKNSREIVLVIPGFKLIEDRAYRELLTPAGRLPALELIVARSRQVKSSACNLDDTLCQLFGMPLAAGSNLPVAALAHSLQFETSSEYWYIQCDPVVMQPNRDYLMMLGNDMLDLSAQEAEQIIMDINATYHDQPWQLKMLSPRQWVMEMPQAAAIRTHPLNSVVGKKINDYLPHGSDARTWHALMNELQMFMHSHPVNQSRATSGLDAVNSVWFWGEGFFPTITEHATVSRWVQCWSNHAPTLALAKLNKIPRVDLPVTANTWLERAITPGQHLVMIDNLDLAGLVMDPVSWWQALSQLNEQWFTPLLSALQNNTLSKITLVTADGHSYELTSVLAKRWWKQIKTLF